MNSSASLSRLDLNLLVALDALLTERSVSRAAQRLRLSQPSLSASLARLRTHFADPLLVRRGNSHDLSPLAVRLIDQVSSTLESARRIFEEQAEWDPSTATREFSVYMSDYGLSTVAPVVSRIAREEAPGIRFRFLLHNPTIVDDASETLRDVCGIVIPHGYLSDLPYVDLFNDEWMLVMSADNPLAHRPRTVEDLADVTWVYTFQTRTAFTSASRQLQYMGIEPHVEVVVESFLALPLFVRDTDRVGLLQRGLLASLPSIAGVVAVEPPFDAAPISSALWWHPVHRGDPAHAWARDLFDRAGRQLTREWATDRDVP
ncbi:LysR family transcriptional regulator [Microbacterium aoyamense]|uniref:LysR family transcriptional regulator n=1 Tax=Microbacterium aoyamense TaxID=344166 RepID=A0ABP5B9T6_9MICO|nr:LysR substrate-binding domain-containing protein [Microbacterium aoyamense]